MSGLADAVRDPGVRVLAVLGPGGVGKTTTSAALGLAAAQAGRRVVVLTIDPARRLAQAMGLGSIGTEPQAVPLPDDAEDAGTLEVMMLDMRRTFDEVVRARTDAETAARVLTNPMYESLSTSLAGTQEFMAMERLGQVVEDVGPGRRWDLVVVDTPPARSALDFLDAPQRLGGFLDSRLFRLLAMPARVGTRVGSRVLGGRGEGGQSLARRVLGSVLGGSLVDDVAGLLHALDTVLTGFAERAARTRALLASDASALIVVTAPERGPAHEARTLIEQMAADGLEVAAVVANRVVTAAERPGIQEARAAVAASADEGRPHEGIAAAALDVQIGRARDARRHAQVVRELRRDVRSRGIPVVAVPATEVEVQQLEALSAIGQALLRRT